MHLITVVFFTVGTITVWTGANDLVEFGNTENFARFTPSGNTLGIFISCKYYFVINKNNRYNG